MSENGSGLTRRDFLRGAAVAAIGGAAAPRAPAESGSETKPKAEAPKSRVVLVRDVDVLDGEGKARGDVLERMLDAGVAALAGKPAPEAWKSWFSPQDTVGIKSNVWRFLPTPPDLERTIRDRLIAAGVKAERIAVDDRGVRKNPVFREATALVNVRPMRTHHWSGVGSLLKNYIMFVEDPSAWHGDSCADLAGIWKLPAVAGKTRLNVLVLLTPLFHSVGPHDYSAKYTWPYRGLLVGTDPVAVDATGLRILEAKRRLHFGADEPFPVPPKHIRAAETKHALGVADPAKIDLVKLGWEEGVMV